MLLAFAIEVVDQTRGCGKSQLRSPLCCVQTSQWKLVAVPSAIEIEMQPGGRQAIQRGVGPPRVSLLKAKRRFSAASASFGRKRNASLNSAMASGVCPNF